MDPLSIAAGVVPLLEATGFITTSLYKLVKAHRSADARISGLCQELSDLKNSLKSVDKSLRQFGPGTLEASLIDDDLRREIDQALVNCELSVGELGLLVQKIESRRHGGFTWKSRAAMDLALHEDELAAHRDKIHKSNSALRTILSTINVSLSLRSNRSQTQILFELTKLKSSIDEALRISTRPAGGFSQGFSPLSDRIAGNLFQLAEAARTFHSAATSTASTVREGQSTNASMREWRQQPDSLAGHLPSFKRQRVEEFIRQGTVLQRETSPSPRPSPPPSARQPRAILTNLPARHDTRASIGETPIEKTAARPPVDDLDDEGSDEEDEDDLERVYLSGLRELAVENVCSLKLDEAVPLLEEVLEDPETASSNRSLKLQLAICYFLKGRWEKAEVIVTELARRRTDRDAVVCELLHALTIAQLTHDKSAVALKTCNLALQSKKRLCKEKGDALPWASYHNTMGLLHVVCLARGDSNRAEVFRRQIPADFDYEHCEASQAFIARNETLIRAFFQLKDDDAVSTQMLDWVSQSTAAPDDEDEDSSSCSAEDGAHFRGKRARTTRSNDDADDEASPVSPVSPLSPQAVKNGFARIFGRMMPRRASREALEATGPSPQRSVPLSRDQGRPRKPNMLFKKRREPRNGIGGTIGDNDSADRKATKVLSWNQASTDESQSTPPAETSMPDAEFYRGGQWVTAEEHQRRHAARPPRQCEAMDTAIFEMADTSLPPELSDTGLTPMEIIQKHSRFGRAHPSHNWAATARDASESLFEMTDPKSPLAVEDNFTVILGRVASALASIPMAKDADRLQALRFELELLSSDLRESNDPVLRADIAAAVESLKGFEAVKKDDTAADDSGYESSRSADRAEEPAGSGGRSLPQHSEIREQRFSDEASEPSECDEPPDRAARALSPYAVEPDVDAWPTDRQPEDTFHVRIRRPLVPDVKMISYLFERTHRRRRAQVMAPPGTFSTCKIERRRWGAR